MRILVLLSYYRPHISGLTLAAANEAEALAAAGHTVTVLTSRHDPALPGEETLNGVKVVRAPVLLRLGKGVIPRGYMRRLRELLRVHDAVLLYVPAAPVETLAAAALARLLHKPLVMEYGCDIRLPGGIGSRLIEACLAAAHRIAGRAATAVVAFSEDYACTSPVLKHMAGKLAFALPVIRIPVPDAEESAALRRRLAPGGETVAGIAGRMAAEKGFDRLLDAIPILRRELPRVVVAHAGGTDRVIGEAACRHAIGPRIAALGETWKSLGVLQPGLANFYAACDVLVLPSVNRTESFGMVQVEAMLCGTPVVASDLPGVRVPVMRTGMGTLVRPGDPRDLARGILEVVRNRERFVLPRDRVENALGLADTLRIRTELYRRLTRQP